MTLPRTLFLAPGVLLCVGVCVALPVHAPHLGAGFPRVHARLDLEQAADVTPEPAGFPLLKTSPTFVAPITTVTVATVTVTLSSTFPSASAGFGCSAEDNNNHELIGVKSTPDVLSCTYSADEQCIYSLQDGALRSGSDDCPSNLDLGIGGQNAGSSNSLKTMPSQSTSSTAQSSYALSSLFSLETHSPTETPAPDPSPSLSPGPSASPSTTSWPPDRTISAIQFAQTSTFTFYSTPVPVTVPSTSAPRSTTPEQSASPAPLPAAASAGSGDQGPTIGLSVGLSVAFLGAIGFGMWLRKHRRTRYFNSNQVLPASPPPYALPARRSSLDLEQGQSAMPADSGPVLGRTVYADSQAENSKALAASRRAVLGVSAADPQVDDLHASVAASAHGLESEEHRQLAAAELQDEDVEGAPPSYRSVRGSEGSILSELGNLRPFPQ